MVEKTQPIKIDPEKEQKIAEYIEKEVKSVGDKEDLLALSGKLADAVAKLYPGETWICKVEMQPKLLKWYEKPSIFFTNKKQQEAMKKLLKEQAPNHEKLMVATSNYKIYLVRSKLEVSIYSL